MTSPSHPPLTDMVYHYAALIGKNTPDRIADTLQAAIHQLCTQPPEQPITPMDTLTLIEDHLTSHHGFTQFIRTIYKNTLHLGHPGIPLSEARIRPIIYQTVNEPTSYAFNPPPRIRCGSRDDREIYITTNPTQIMRVAEIVDAVIAIRTLTHPPVTATPICLWRHTPTTTL